MQFAFNMYQRLYKKKTNKEKTKSKQEMFFKNVYIKKREEAKRK